MLANRNALISASAAASSPEKPTSGRGRRAHVADRPDARSGDPRRLSAIASSMKRVITRRPSSWITAGARGRDERVDLVEQGPGKATARIASSKIEQAGAQAVVDVMGVIGDVVGDRRRLRLETREGGKVEALARS
jgi:hypothetical protein